MGRQISGVECALELGYCETSPRGMATALYRGKSFHWSCQIYPACQGILCVTEKVAYSLVSHLAPPAIWWQNNIYIYIGIKNDLNALDATSKCSSHVPRERHSAYPHRIVRKGALANRQRKLPDGVPVLYVAPYACYKDGDWLWHLFEFVS